MRKVCLLFFLSILLCVVANGNADTDYTVRKGDSLYDISRKFHVPVPAIKEANNLKSNRLAIGTALFIPNGTQNRENNTSKEGLRKKASEKRQTRAAENRYHVVRKGETLKKIARKHSLSEEELREMNHLTTDRLKFGQELIVKRAASKTYAVKKGDTLEKVAKKTKVSIDDLKEINELESDSLKPGQKLLLAKNDEATDEPPSLTTVPQDRPNGPVKASLKLQEVKELSASEELLQMSVGDRLMLFAKKMLHLPYRFGGNGSIGIDCSAYVQKVFNLVGIDLPRSAREQYKVGESVDKEELSIGDLVFFRTYASFPSHVGIYLGNNLFIHASSRSRQVTIDSLETPYYLRRFIGAKRLIPDAEAQEKESAVKEDEPK